MQVKRRKDINCIRWLLSINVKTRRVCELCLHRTKSGETLMEVRRIIDVQIICQM